MHSRARFPLSCSGEKLSCHPSTPSQCSSTMKIFDRPQMSLLSRGVMAQKNNDSDQQTEIAVRQLQPPHTQAGSQTHRHATFSYQEKHKTFFCWQTAGKLRQGQREPRRWKGRILTWAGAWSQGRRWRKRLPRLSPSPFSRG